MSSLNSACRCSNPASAFASFDWRGTLCNALTVFFFQRRARNMNKTCAPFVTSFPGKAQAKASAMTHTKSEARPAVTSAVLWVPLVQGSPMRKKILRSPTCQDTVKPLVRCHMWVHRPELASRLQTYRCSGTRQI